MPVAADIPPRKAGLGDIKMTMASLGGAGIAFRQCIDAETDQTMMSERGPMAQDVLGAAESSFAAA
jgi:hypothetical protein